MRAIRTTRITMWTLTILSCLPSRFPPAITSFNPATIYGKVFLCVFRSLWSSIKLVSTSGMLARAATEPRSTASLSTLSEDAALLSSGGVSTAISYGQQNSSLTASCTCSRAASSRCGRIPRTSKAASGSYACERIKWTELGRTSAWRCSASSSWWARRSVASSSRRSIQKTYSPFGIARPPTWEVQIE